MALDKLSEVFSLQGFDTHTGLYSKQAGDICTALAFSAVLFTVRIIFVAVTSRLLQRSKRVPDHDTAMRIAEQARAFIIYATVWPWGAVSRVVLIPRDDHSHYR